MRTKANREKERRRFLTVAQLAERWALSLAHAYRMIERGEVPAMRCGHALRVPLEAVEDYEKRGAVA